MLLNAIFDPLFYSKGKTWTWNPPAVRDLQKRLERLEAAYSGLYDLPVTVEILPITSELEWTQLFADVAQNARGITGDVKTWFDQTKVVNRVARRLIETHPLFVGKTEVGTGVANPYWIKADGVAKIVHAVDKGLSGRYSAPDERRANEEEIHDRVNVFLDAATAAFPLLREIASGTPEYAEERRKEKARSMVMSLSMLRGLAGAHRRLREAGRSKVDFSPLADKMAVPIDRRFWLKIAPTAFERGTTDKPANPTAPGARGGNVIALANGIADYLDEPSR